MLYELESADMAPSTNRVTLRLPSNVLTELKKEAGQKDLPISSLIGRILNKHVGFDRRFKSVPTIIMSEVLFAMIIENMSEATIEKVAKQGPKVVKKLCSLSGWKYEVTSVIDNYFSTLSKYGGWFRFNHEIDHLNYTLIFESRLGEKWIKFLSLYIRSILESMKIHIDNESIDEDVIIFKFTRK